MGIICSFFHWSMAGLYDVGNTCDSFVGSLWPFFLQGKTTPGWMMMIIINTHKIKIPLWNTWHH
jgi:hypothetical protein